MRRCKHVGFYDGFNHDLEETTEKNHYKLNKIEGKIDFCESNRRGLVIRLSNHLNPKKTDGKEIIWSFEKGKPLPAVCGQGLRCFYERTQIKGDVEEIEMDAYELLDKPNSDFVIRRATKQKEYKFVDFD